MAKPLSKEQIFRLQQQAKQSIEVDGKSQKETATELNISEKTIGIWILKFKWKKINVMDIVRRKAKKLVVSQGFTQKEAAKMVGVSEKTIGKWAVKYQWKSNTKFITPTLEQQEYTLKEFARYIEIGNKGDAVSFWVKEFAPLYLTYSSELTQIIRDYEEQLDL